MATTQQSNNSNKTLLVTLFSVLGVITLVVLVVVGSAIGAYNSGNRFEQRIQAVYSNNQNILSNYTQKVQEAAQVTDMQRDDIAKVINGALAGRYGEGGAKAVFQAIHEQKSFRLAGMNSRTTRRR
jgi:ABC-type lipoprotein release transport system permease subunit